MIKINTALTMVNTVLTIFSAITIGTYFAVGINQDFGIGSGLFVLVLFYKMDMLRR
jgi:hypothetical protein